jgi:glycosyltransferase involved in cell wall biosynthesis
MKLPVTVLVATRNEEANLAKCLATLAPAERVVVLDSHSTDGTAAAARAAGAEVVLFDYAGGYPKKRQWALDNLPMATPWVLLVDADEEVPAALWDEVAGVMGAADPPAACLATKEFHFLGRRFRFGGFSHAAVILIRGGRARFERLLDEPADGFDMEVHERVIVDGRTGRLRAPLIHRDFKGLDAYLARHARYAGWEARVRRAFLDTGRYGEDAIVPRLLGNAQERRRWLKRLAVRVPFEPALWFLYHYVLRLGFLEGRSGLLASRIRMSYIGNVRQLAREWPATPCTSS